MAVERMDLSIFTTHLGKASEKNHLNLKAKSDFDKADKRQKEGCACLPGQPRARLLIKMFENRSCQSSLSAVILQS